MRSTVFRRRWVFVVATALVVALLTGLNGCYYLRAANGQWQVLRERQDIDTLLNAGSLESDVAERLTLARDARRFAIDELMLPDNGSYASYTDLGRPYVVWNVFAAPALSVAPYTWCFPVVGCVSYRGHFKQVYAERDAEKLRKRGYDTYVGGVAAYSTLGRFRDPVLNTMLTRDSVALVATLFHELAHQQFYVKGDTEFNESYATAVADIGLARWADTRISTDAIAAYQRRRTLRDEFNALALATRERLQAVYASERSDEAKMALKQQAFADLATQYQALADARGLPASPRAPSNNAMLVPIATYYTLVPAFLHVYEDCERALPCFYARTAEVAALADNTSRRAALPAVP
ncbi:MAG: aminopeptidase [Pseudomonadota bacterium]